MDGPFYKEAFNTLRAGRLELLMARLFGKKTTGYDGLFWVTMARWRGKIYFLGSGRSNCHHETWGFAIHGRRCPQCGELITDFGD